MAIGAAVVEEEQLYQPKLDCPEQRAPAAATILLVEDEAFVREVTGEVLRSAGYRVFIARNPKEAELLHEKYGDEMDLLITDIVLPGEDGCALAQKLREKQPRLRVLFVTGYGNRMEGHDGDELDWLAKPFSSLALLERVGKLLNRENKPEVEEIRHACGNELPEGSGWGFEKAVRRG